MKTSKVLLLSGKVLPLRAEGEGVPGRLHIERPGVREDVVLEVAGVGGLVGQVARRLADRAERARWARGKERAYAFLTSS